MRFSSQSASDYIACSGSWQENSNENSTEPTARDPSWGRISKGMNGVQTVIKLLPVVLVWVVEWVIAPVTMLWLCLRWVLWGPLLEKPDDVLTLDQRRATKEATA